MTTRPALIVVETHSEKCIVNPVNEALTKPNETKGPKPKNKKPRGLVNRPQIKRLVLDLAERNRPSARFTRVGSDVYDRVEALIRKELVHLVTTHPSKGRTIRYTDQPRKETEA